MYILLFKGYWQRVFLMPHLKELMKLFNNLFYSLVISLLVLEILTVEVSVLSAILEIIFIVIGRENKYG